MTNRTTPPGHNPSRGLAYRVWKDVQESDDHDLLQEDDPLGGWRCRDCGERATTRAALARSPCRGDEGG